MEITNNNKNKNINNFIKNVFGSLLNYIDTYDRQRGVVLDSVLKRESNSTIIKLIATCLMVLVFIYLLKKLNLLNYNISIYCSYFIIVLFIGIGVFKFTNIFNRKTYKYQEKEFKKVNNDIKNEKEDIKKII